MEKLFYTTHHLTVGPSATANCSDHDVEGFRFRCFCGNQKHLMLQLILVKRILNLTFSDVNQPLTNKEQDVKAGSLHLPSNVLLHFSWHCRYWSASDNGCLVGLRFWHTPDHFHRCFLVLLTCSSTDFFGPGSEQQAGRCASIQQHTVLPPTTPSTFPGWQAVLKLSDYFFHNFKIWNWFAKPVCTPVLCRHGITGQCFSGNW